MSPLDDELRSALQRRATAVAPSPDPLAGIERRAVRIQRNRVAASIAGSVLAVAAIATAVPLLTGPAGPGPDVPRFATTQPSAPPSSVLTWPAYAFDVDRPWPYRGAPLPELGQGFLETATREYAVLRGVDEARVELTPLFGQVDEPSQSAEAVFVATVDGQARWGVVSASEAGPEFLVDAPLPSPALALAAALPGDEVPRLLVVASPQVGEIQYGPDDASEFSTMTSLADGVAVTGLDGDPATASYRVLDPSGAELLRAPVPAGAGADAPPSEDPAPEVTTAPDVTAPASPAPDVEQPPPGDDRPAPTNVVDWPLRGSVPADVAEQALAAFADAAGVSRDEIGSKLLFGGQRNGRAYVLLQGWYGSDARAFAWAGDPGGTAASVLLPFTAPGPAAFGVVLDGVLMVVPEPAAGQVLYSPDGTSEPAPVPDQGTEAAVLLERPAGATSDRLLVLDGNGDPERPIYRGTVEELLAASAS